MSEDISKKIQRLSENLENMEIFAKKTPMPCCMVDEKMNYVFFNDAWENTFIHSRKPKRGDNHYDLFPHIPKEYPQFVAEHQSCLLQRKQIRKKNIAFEGILLNYILEPIYLSNGNKGMIMIVDFIEK